MENPQQERGQAPPPPWYPPPAPPPPSSSAAGGGYHYPQYPHHQPPIPPPHLHHQPYTNQLPPHQLPPPPWAPAPDYSQYHQPPPPPPAAYHHQIPPPVPPPYLQHHSMPPPMPSYPSAAGPPHMYHPQGPQPSQVWGSSSWNHQQGWEHSDRNVSYNEEDWAARARAWAAGNSAENHPTQTQFTSVRRMEESNYAYPEPFPQAATSQTEIQQPPFSTSQHFSVSVSDPHTQAKPLQDPSSVNLETSYATEGRTSYASRSEGPPAIGTISSTQVNFGLTPSVLEQEVPSNYSSISGKEAGGHHERLHVPFPPTSTSNGNGLHNAQPMASFQSMRGQPSLRDTDQFGGVSTDACDRPLVFEQRYTIDHEQKEKMTYRDVDLAGPLRSTDHNEAASSIYARTPFSSVFPVPSGQQVDSSSTGHTFLRISGADFHANISLPRAPFTLGSGANFYLPTTFPEDSNLASNSVERPKKAPVPNWLREELLKKKATITSSVQEQSTGIPRSMGIELADKSLGKGEEADSRSIDSTRSEEDDDDDEEELEAARSAAINQEIKRVLTEILLKVTDELFEEIATKVIHEDDLTVEVDQNIPLENLNPFQSPLASRTSKVSAKATTPVIKSNKEVGQVENFSHTSSGGNVLGLANYASDNEDEEGQSPKSRSPPRTDGISMEKSSDKAMKTTEKGTTKWKVGSGEDQFNPENGSTKISIKGSLLLGKMDSSTDPQDVDRHSDRKDTYRAMPESSSGTELESTAVKKSDTGNEIIQKHDCNDQPGGRPVSFNGKHDIITSNDNVNVVERGSTAGRGYLGDKKHLEGETRSRTKEKSDRKTNLYRDSKNRDFKQTENVDASEPRKSSIRESDTRHERGSKIDKYARTKEDGYKKREQSKHMKEDTHGHVDKEVHRSKSRRSPSPSIRVANNKVNSSSSYGGASSSEVSESLKKRKPHSSRRSLSLSPPRSRSRQASRSPHAKHSQRRQSPPSYSKMRRSRSRSPAHRRK